MNAKADSCADVLAKELYAAGIRYVFGHPGGEVVDLIEALARHNIEFILVGHESAAAFMAATIGRITGIPGACLSTLGPGACNLLLGIGSALLDRDPMLAISARSASDVSRKNQKQDIPLNDIFEPASKWSEALDGINTRSKIARAIKLAGQSPKGPVFLSLPTVIALKPDYESEGQDHEEINAIATNDNLSRLATVLNQASTPVGIIGMALEPEKDAKAVRNFFSKTGIPFAVLPQAKGIGDEDAENFLGVVASAAGDSHIIKCIEKSDVVIGFGFDTVESAQSWHFDRRILSIANASIAYGEFIPMIECIGDVDKLAIQLTDSYDSVHSWSDTDIENVQRHVKLDIEPNQSSSDVGLSPFHTLKLLQETLPSETIVSVDVGAHKMLTSQAWRSTAPGSFLVSNGMSSMGYGVPAALAASLMNPERPVIGIIGDGGFGMMVQELETAVRMRVKPLLIVFCDRSLAVIKIAQKNRNLPHRGVDFRPVNWAQVVSGFGVRAVNVSTLDELSETVVDWLKEQELTVVAVTIDETLYRGLTY